LTDPFTPCLASETGLLLEFRTNEPSQKQGTAPSVTIGWGRWDCDTIVFDISGSHSGFH